MSDKRKAIIEKTVNEIKEYFKKVLIAKEIPKSEWKVPEGYKFEILKIPSVDEKGNKIEIILEHLFPLAQKSKKIIYFLHGGAYVLGLDDSYREAAVEFSKLTGGAEVYLLEYRIAPAYTYPAALNDAVACYKWFIEEKKLDTNNICSIGDSAGGNLVLSLILYLKDKKIPLPKAVIALCPWANPASDSKSYTENNDKDLYLGKNGLKVGERLHNSSYFVNCDLKNDPYVAPIYGNYKGFPKMLIQVGSYDLLLDDAKMVAEKAKKEGVDVKLTIYEEVPHDFQLVFVELDETKLAWKEMIEFINETMK